MKPSQPLKWVIIKRGTDLGSTCEISVQNVIDVCTLLDFVRSRIYRE